MKRWRRVGEPSNFVSVERGIETSTGTVHVDVADPSRSIDQTGRRRSHRGKVERRPRQLHAALSKEQPFDLVRLGVDDELGGSPAELQILLRAPANPFQYKL